MDASYLQQLAQVFEGTMSNDTTIRQQAEQFLKTNQKTAGFGVALLEISGNKDLNPNVSLGAAVQLSNLVEYHWKFADATHAQKIAGEGFDYTILSEEDKNNVRTQLVAKMYECEDQKIIKQYSRCIITIARLDYPTKWPTLLSQDITNALNSQNEKGILTGLIALFGLVKKYEYEMEEDREPLYAILQSVFATLGNLIN